jgi:two-component system, sensor histidine kinase and response regulator
LDKILIIEDEKDARENIVELLTNEGYTCIEAEDGMSGTEVIKNELPDLILCDLMMPRIDGFEFFQIVKSMNLDKFIPFIFLTARTDDDSIQYGMGMGADDFITKPFKADALLQRIKSRLIKKRSIEHKFDQLKLNLSLYVPHELRTPLISILGYSEFLLNEFDSFTDIEKKEMIHSIYHSGLRFHDRIEKFVNFSELQLEDSEKSILQKSDYINPAESNFNTKLGKCFECRDRISDMSMNFEDASLMILRRDFEVMLMELFENACKFSPVGSQIEVVGLTINDSYQITVKNEGPELDSTVLESFHQKNKNYNQQNGNGIGLAIVEMITKKYNSKLKIYTDDAVYVKVNIPIDI